MKMKVHTVISICLASISLILALAIYGQLPTTMAIHWNIDGIADYSVSKNIAILIFPALILANLGCMKAAMRYSSRKENLARSVTALDTAVAAGAIVFAVLHLMMLAAALQWTVNVPRVAVGCIGFLFAMVGNKLGKTRSNRVVGIRTKWTLSSEYVWDRTNRVGGRLFFAEGISFILLALLMPNTEIPLLVGIFLVILLTAFGLSRYSHNLAKRESA